MFDSVSYILRISLDNFLKETIEMQPLDPELNVSKHFLRNIERSENPETSDSFESFKNPDNSSIGRDTVH